MNELIENTKNQKDNEKYPGQQCQDDIVNTAFREFHKKLIKEIIHFCDTWNISIDEFHLSCDNFEESIKCKRWHPYTDSCLVFNKFSQDYNQKPFLYNT